MSELSPQAEASDMELATTRLSASALSRFAHGWTLGRFRCDSDKKRICSANPGFSSSLRSTLPRSHLLSASLLSRFAGG